MQWKKGCPNYFVLFSDGQTRHFQKCKPLLESFIVVCAITKEEEKIKVEPKEDFFSLMLAFCLTLCWILGNKMKVSK